MKKKLLAILFTFLFIFSIASVSTFAVNTDINPETTVDTTLAGIIKNAKDGESITLDKDYLSEVGPFLIGDNKTITIDLNGHKISGITGQSTFTTKKMSFIDIEEGSSLIIKDSQNNSEKGIDISPEMTRKVNHYFFYVKGSLTIESGKIVGHGDGNYGSTLVYIHKGTVTINGGTLDIIKNGENNKYDHTFGSEVKKQGYLYINGGKILNNDKGYLFNCKGGTNVYISAGEIVNNSTDKFYYTNTSFTHPDYYISGGKITDNSENTTLDKNAHVSGGYFNKPIPQESCEVGKIPSNLKNEEGYYTVEDKPITKEEAILSLEYTSDGQIFTKYFINIESAFDYANGINDINKKMVVLKECNEPNTNINTSYLGEFVVNKGVTLTCNLIKINNSSKIKDKTIFENNGTIVVSKYIGDSEGLGKIINNGTISVPYIENKFIQISNNGAIQLGIGSSTFKNLQNSQNAKLTGVDGTTVTFKGANSNININGNILGCYKWDATSNNWISYGLVEVLLNGQKIATFEDIRDAYDYSIDSNADTLKLLSNVNNTLLITSTITIDLNGFELSGSHSMIGYGVLTIIENGNLTIKDTSLNGTGIVYSTNTCPVVLVHSNAVFTLENGTIKGNQKEATIILGNRKHTNGDEPTLVGATNAYVNIKGGNVINDKERCIIIYGNGKVKDYRMTDPVLNIYGGLIESKENVAITGQGVYNNTTINIEGGTIQSGTNTAIYHPQFGRLYISGGKITGLTGVSLKGGNAYISGNAIIEGVGPKRYPTAGASSASFITGDGFYLEDNYNRTPIAEVSGGTFISTNAAGINKLFGPTVAGVEPGKIIITGGTFNNDPTQYLESKEYKAELVNGQYEVNIVNENIILTYTENGIEKTEYFFSLTKTMHRIEEMAKDIAKTAIVKVIKDINEPEGYFCADQVKQLIINEGVTVTCDIIKMGDSDLINGTILVNNGTLKVNSMPYSYGHGILENNGTIYAGYISTKVEGWINNGTIILGYNNETKDSSFGQMAVRGTIEGERAGVFVTFKDTDMFGSYVWKFAMNRYLWSNDGNFTVTVNKKNCHFIKFEDALDYMNANNATTVKVKRDVVLKPITIIETGTSYRMTIDHDVIIDLNGHTIQWDSEYYNRNIKDAQIFFNVINNAKVNIIGKGAIDTYLGNNTSYAFDLNSEKSILTIENGTFTGAPTVVQVNEGTLVINGGLFKLAQNVTASQAKYIINCIDNSYRGGYAKVVINGGTFGFDPSNNPEGQNTTYVAENSFVIPETNCWNVVLKNPNVKLSYAKDGLNFVETYMLLSEAQDKYTELYDKNILVKVEIINNINEPEVTLCAYKTGQFIINKGVKLTVHSVVLGKDATVNRIVLDNKGTINADYFSTCKGNKILQNDGTINTGYMKSEIIGLQNNGIINLGWGNSIKDSYFADEEISGIVSNKNGTIVKFKGEAGYNTYIWNSTSWELLNCFDLIENGISLGQFYEFNKVMETIAKDTSKDYTILLTKDILVNGKVGMSKDIYSAMIINHSVILDMNGHKIGWKDITSTYNYTPVFFEVNSGAKVTIKGNGTIDASLGNDGSYGIWLNDAQSVLTIENGTFIGAPSAVQVTEGTLNVNGGTYKLAEGAQADQAKYIVNCIDANFKAGTANINIKGGTFGFDPSDNPEGANTSYLVDGFVAKLNANGLYDIVAINNDYLTSVRFGNDLSLIFFFEKGLVNGNGHYVVIKHLDKVIKIENKDNNWKTHTIEGKEYYVVEYSGIAGKEMSDTISIQLFKGDKELTTVYETSIRHYSMLYLEQFKDDAKMNKVIVDMLNYGASAQQYFNYNVDDLANKLLTEEQKGFATVDGKPCNSKFNKDDTQNKYFGTTIRFNNKINIIFVFNDLTEQNKVKLTFTHYNKPAETVSVEFNQFVKTSDGKYVVELNELVVADARQIITCEVYDETGKIATITDSVESYIHDLNDTSSTLFKDFMKFSDASYDYFINKN